MRNALDPGTKNLYGVPFAAVTESAPALYELAGRAPDDLARDDGRQRRTWGELEARTNAVGHGVEAMGLVPGDHVAVVVTNRVEFLEVLLGAQKAGMVVTPVKTNWTPGEIGYLLGDAGSRVVATDVDSARQAGAETGVPVLDIDAGYEGWLAAQDTSPLPRDRRGWRMSYTSGTTGRPKGVVRAGSGQTPFCDMLTAAVGWAEALRLPGEGTHLVVSQLFHGAPLTFALATMARGASLRILPRWKPDAALDAVETSDEGQGVTSTIMVPTMFRQLLALPAERRGRFSGPDLQTVLHGGEPCPVELKRRMIDWWGPIFVEYFGYTEGGMTIATTEEWLARPGTVGRALPYQRIVVLGPEGEELPPGQEGIVASVPNDPTSGTFEYKGDPEKTARAHVAPKAVTAGDIGYLDADGYLFISGRSAEVIVSAGVNVYPAEIEEVVFAVDGVADACVVAGPDADRGEVPVAFISIAPGHDLAAVIAAVESACAEQLAGYKRPRRVEVRAEIARDPTGKVLRKALRDELWDDNSPFAVQTSPGTLRP